jgi:hypothetical protein
MPKALQPKVSSSSYKLRNYEGKSYMVPPAFPEIRQPVSEGDLKELEGNTANPASFYISNDHHLEPPTEQVGNEVNVHCGIPNVGYHVVWVIRSEKPAVLSVAFFRQWLSKLRVKELEYGSSFLQWLEEKIDHEKIVDGEHSQ